MKAAISHMWLRDVACGIIDCVEVLTGQEDRITLLTYSVYWLMKTAAEIGGTEIMTKKEVLEMLDDMEERVLHSNGFIAGFVTQGFILKPIDEKKSEVEALEGT